MNIEDKINIEANKMFDKYFPYYFEKYPRRKEQIRKKYFSYFEKASRMFCCREGYDAEKLISAFIGDGFKMPQQLPIEVVWFKYLQYLPGLRSKETREIEVAQEIINAAIELKRNGSVGDWLNKKLNQRALEIKAVNFSLILFSFSITFQDYCKNNSLDYNLENYRREVLSLQEPHRTKILKKIKELLKDDCIKLNI